MPESLNKFGVDVKKIHYVINTHTHSDHFNEATLDSAWIMYDEVEEIIKHSPIDFAVLDGTIGFIEGD